MSSFASMQLDLPDWLQAKCRAWVLANVGQEELFSADVQDDGFHITVRYGLCDPDLREVEAALQQGCGPVRIALGRVEQLEAEEYDVLAVPCVKHDGLFTDRQHLPSRPHVTLAYIQKGRGQRHLGDASFLGDAATLDRLWYSDSTGRICWVSLSPTRRDAAESVRLTSCAVEQDLQEASLAQIEFSRNLTPYERKVDFVVLDSETKKLVSQGADRVKQLLRASKKKLLALIASRHTAGTLTSKFVLDLDLRGLGQLVPTLREALGAAFRLGQREASKELKKTFAHYTSDFDESEHPREEDGKFAPKGGGKAGENTGSLKEIRALLQDPDKMIDFVLEKIGEDFKGAVGLRTLRGDQGLGELSPSFVWDDGVQTEKELEGASVIGISADWELDSREALFRRIQDNRRNLSYGKGELALVVGDYARGGEDIGEMIIPNARAIYIWKRKESEQKEKWFRSYQVKLDPTGLPPEKALEFFERKAVLWGADIRQPLLGEVKNILFDGIKQGTPLRELMARIEQTYLPWLGDPDQAVEGAMLTPYRLETLVRTNVTEALNEGRKAQFQEAVDDGFVIGLTYSAVLDARTTEVCRHLDEKVFLPDSPDLDRLTPPRHWNCFIDGQTAVYTAKGWTQIAKIAVGDLVLTDKGQMQPVTFVHHKQNPQKYDGEVVKITVRTVNTASLKGKLVQRFLTVTPEHPVLVNGRWVYAGEIKAGDSVSCLGSPCQTCGKVIPWLASEGRGDALVCCSRVCFGKYAFKNTWNDSKWRRGRSEDARLQMRKEYANGTRDRFAITKKANEETRKRFAEGRGVLQRPEVRAKMLQAKTASAKWWYSITEGRRGDKNPLRKHPESARRASDKLQAFLKANPHKHGNRVMGRAVMAGHVGYLSKGHRKLFSCAQQLEIGVVGLEFPIQTTEKYFYADIAFPEHKIALEFDGSHWHQDVEKDRMRDEALAAVGWKTLRYRDAVPTLTDLSADVSRVIANHNREYVFTSVFVEKVERWKLKKARRLYNLSVLEDESFIAKGFVVHNCRSLLVPITRLEGPVTYITPAQVAKGVELSGKGFGEEVAARRYEWNEEEHTREEDGKFAFGGAGSGAASNAKSENAIRAVGSGKERTFVNADGSPVDAETQARIDALGIPPGRAGVQVSADPQSPLQAIGYDASGKEQPRYSKQWTTAANAAKHLRVAELARDGYKKMVAGVRRDLARGVEEAVVMRLVTATAMRIGGDSEKAVGATTLQARHLSVEGDLVRFDFPGKSGKQWTGAIRDEQLATQISARLEGKSGTGRVFATDAGKVNAYLKQYGRMSAKDVRTLQGTAVAMRELKRLGEPRTVKEARSFIKLVSTKVSEHLRNTPAVAKSSYISSAVWTPIQAKFGISVGA